MFRHRNFVESKNKIYSILVITAPVFSCYKSLIQGLDLGTILLAIFCIVSLPTVAYLEKKTMLFLYIGIFTPLAIILWGTLYTSLATILLRYEKMMFYLFIACVTGYKKYYNESIAMKAMKIVVYLAVILVLVQQLSYIFWGVVIKNPFIQFAENEAYMGSTYGAGSLFRPCAFFLEPAHMASYCAPFLLYSVFKTEKYLDIIVTSIGMLCSGAGTGIYIILICVGYYLYRKTKRTFLVGMGLIIVVIIIIYYLYTLPYIRMVVERVSPNNLNDANNSFAGRFEAGYEVFTNGSMICKLFGNGYGNIVPKKYFNGVSYALTTIGIFGLSILIWNMSIGFSKKEIWKKTGLIITLIYLFFSQLFSPTNVLLYMTIY